MNLFQMLGSVRDPNKFVEQIMSNSPMSNNPIAKNAFEMYRKGDTRGLNELANNLCQENGITFEEAVNKVKSQLGM